METGVCASFLLLNNKNVVSEEPVGRHRPEVLAAPFFRLPIKPGTAVITPADDGPHQSHSFHSTLIGVTDALAECGLDERALAMKECVIAEFAAEKRSHGWPCPPDGLHFVF